MKLVRIGILALVGAVAVTASTFARADNAAYWPNWRGPAATGVAAKATPPTTWSESKNVRWKVDLPGRGAGSPIVWGDYVYVTTAVPVDAASAKGSHRYVVMALARKDGKVAWQHTAKEEAPHEGTHNQFGTMASSSAVTDGEHVILMSGSAATA